MAFEIRSVNLDAAASQATVTAWNQSSDPVGSVSVQFPFKPGGSDDWHAAIDAAKTILKQALTDLPTVRKEHRKA
jgi:hypothetical protein